MLGAKKFEHTLLSGPERLWWFIKLLIEKQGKNNDNVKIISNIQSIL